MEIKLKSGRKLKVKNISVDERDELLDGVSYNYDSEGGVAGVKMMHSTMTKWLRTCIDGDVPDSFIKSMALEEKSEAFAKFQSLFFKGEEKASK